MGLPTFFSELTQFEAGGAPCASSLRFLKMASWEASKWRVEIGGRVGTPHLFFIDDSLLFPKEDCEKLLYTRWILLCSFQGCAWLRVDLEKSELISVSEKWGMWNLVCLQTTWDCEGEKWWWEIEKWRVCLQTTWDCLEQLGIPLRKVFV